MGDATLHRHGDTIPGPNGPPIVPFPRKHLALSAPGGALVLSPLETPLRMRGSGSGERSRGCPLCDPTNAMPANAGTHSGHLGTFSATGRGLLDSIGSPYRSLPRMGELTQMCQLIPDIFSFPPCTAHFLFDVSKRKCGVHPHGKTVHSRAAKWHHAASLRRFAAPLVGAKKKSETFQWAKPILGFDPAWYHHAFPCRKAAPSERSFYV